jgi:hypothetical protein
MRNDQRILIDWNLAQHVEFSRSIELDATLENDFPVRSFSARTVRAKTSRRADELLERVTAMAKKDLASSVTKVWEK